MDEDDGMPSAELRPHRLERVVAEIGAVRVRQDNDAVAAQLVQRVPQLIEAARHVGQRERREVAEPARVLPRQSRAELVDLTRQRPAGRVVTEVSFRRRDRQTVTGNRKPCDASSRPLNCTKMTAPSSVRSVSRASIVPVPFRTHDRPVRSGGSQQLPAQPVALDLGAGGLEDHSFSGWPCADVDRRPDLKVDRAQRHQFDCQYLLPPQH